MLEVLSVAEEKGITQILVEDYIKIDREYAALGCSDGENVIIPGIIQFVRGSKSHPGIALLGEVKPTDGFEQLIKEFCLFVQQIGYVGIFDIDFVDYLSNIYDKQFPIVLNKKLTKAFGKNCFDDDFENKVVDQEKHKALSNKLLEKVLDTPKSLYRSVDENKVMCEVDAKIFLTIIDENRDDVSKDNLLAHKTYLLTQSKRTVYAAKELGYYEKDVICNPNSLIAILNEIGTLKTDMDIVNLFENPFLVYTSEQVWNEIQPLLNAGVRIKGKDIDRLRLDVDVKFDKILTGTKEEKVEESKRLTDRGYSFPKEMADLAVENEEKSKKIEELQNEIEQLKTANRNLKDGANKRMISKMKKRKK